jgi:SAM-dependent methyltransferase
MSGAVQETVEVFPGLTFRIVERVPSIGELQQLYWGFHPRYRFLKTLPRGATLLDYGAGPGGLIHWRRWGMPDRRDLKMIAVDRQKGELFDQYDGWFTNPSEASALPAELRDLDAVLLSHVLEHIHEPDALLDSIHAALRPGGRAYFEVPTPATLELPPRSQVLARGIPISTLAFHDDPTHLRTWSLPHLRDLMERHRLRVLETGVITLPWLEDLLFTAGYRERNEELVTYAVWARTRWAQWVLVEA